MSEEAKKLARRRGFRDRPAVDEGPRRGCTFDQVFHTQSALTSWARMVSKDYAKLATFWYGEYVGLKMAPEEVAAMLKERLQYTGSWADHPEQRKVGPMFLDRKWC